MENVQSIFRFGAYTAYVWSSVGITVALLSVLFWRSQRQLTKQKRALNKSHEA